MVLLLGVSGLDLCTGRFFLSCSSLSSVPLFSLLLAAELVVLTSVVVEMGWR